MFRDPDPDKRPHVQAFWPFNFKLFFVLNNWDKWYSPSPFEMSELFFYEIGFQVKCTMTQNVIIFKASLKKFQHYKWLWTWKSLVNDSILFFCFSSILHWNLFWVKIDKTNTLIFVFQFHSSLKLILSQDPKANILIMLNS